MTGSYWQALHVCDNKNEKGNTRFTFLFPLCQNVCQQAEITIAHKITITNTILN